MKGLSASLQVECDCGELVTIDHNSTGMGNAMPMLKMFEGSCACGKKFFIHVQETKPR